jgi:TRAP transporter 4TM/12TM fusion protein
MADILKDNKVQKLKERKGKRRNLSGFYRILAFIIGFTLTLITVYTAFRGVFLPAIQRSIHICLLLALIYLWYPANKKSSRSTPNFIDCICMILSLFVLFWTLGNHSRFLMRIPLYSEMTVIDAIVGILFVGLVLEAGRRTLGWTITILASIFIAYAFFGPYMPAMFRHTGMTINDFVDHMYLTDVGLFSSLVGLSATLLFSFVAFGTFLQATNADKHFISIALALAGGKPGGPAKVAIISSAAMGTISGSTIANVVTTGNLTIPLMKSTGYKPHEAGAIETVASAAGQIMPPIMGTGAFIMAEVLGVKYLNIVKVSVIPAIIFYITLWFFVDLKAKRKGLTGLKKEDIPKLKTALLEGFPFFIPIIVLITLLVKGFTPFLAGSVSTVLILLISTIKKETRISLKKLALTIEKCAINMTSIAGIIACAAIIVGIINMSGLMIKTTAIILHLSGGYLLTTILLEAVIAYVLGMGLPIATSYIILSTLGAPALIELGVLPIAAHLMIFWFSQLATITPPVCMTAFAAAEIAKANPMKTGFSSLKIGSPFYIVPILFIYTNILSTDVFQAILIGLISIFGFYFMCSCSEGYFYGKLNNIKRILCFNNFIIIIVSMFNDVPMNLKFILLSISIIVTIFIYLSQKKLARLGLNRIT